VSFDAEGHEIWRCGFDEPLYDDDELVALTDGRFAAMSVGDIEILGPEGAKEATVNLRRAWGHAPNHVASIGPDIEGGFVVEDFHAPTVLMRMRADGTLRSAVHPRYSDGRAIENPTHVAAAPDGRLWVADGAAILRLTDDGVVDRTIGPGPDERALQSVESAELDRAGNLFLYDGQSGTMHVFDASGEPTHTCRPSVPAGVAGSNNWPAIVAPDGSVSLPADPTADLDATRLVLCSPDGARREVSLAYRPEHLQGDGRPYWAEDDQDPLLISPDGELLRRIARRPDGQWLESHREGAVAPDGALALTTSTEASWSEIESPWAVSLFSAQGEPIRTLTLPAAFKGRLFAYDGRDLLFARDGEVCVMDAEGHPRQRLLLPSDGGPVTPLLGPGSSEIWTWDGVARRLRRHRRPAAGARQP
jgi:hypothetical protein